MSTVISVEHLSKTYRLGQIGTPSRARGGRPGPSHADLEVWWAKLRGAWRPIPCSALAKMTTLDGYGIIVPMESE